MGDKIPKQKIFQPRQEYKKRNRDIEGVRVSLMSVYSYYPTMIEKKTLAYENKEENLM